VSACAAVMVAIVVTLDWMARDISVGFLYLIPILFSAAALSGPQILALAVLCA